MDIDDAHTCVANVAPVVDADGPYSCNEGQTITLQGSLTDAGADDTHTVAWDFDGDGYYDDAFVLNPSFVCDSSGVFDVSLRVIDDDGGIGIDGSTVTVNSVNSEPNAINDYFTVIEDSSNNQLDVLGNDIDPDHQ